MSGADGTVPGRRITQFWEGREIRGHLRVGTKELNQQRVAKGT